MKEKSRNSWPYHIICITGTKKYGNQIKYKFGRKNFNTLFCFNIFNLNINNLDDLKRNVHKFARFFQIAKEAQIFKNKDVHTRIETAVNIVEDLKKYNYPINFQNNLIVFTCLISKLTDKNIVKLLPKELSMPLTNEAALKAYYEAECIARYTAEGREEGRKEGRKEGREEARKEAREEGREEGRDEQKIEIATKLLKFSNMTLPEIREYCGLSKAKLNSLAKKHNVAPRL
jgi:flagellar biosynthesis/type III secretory pathway protein FliH